MKAWMLNMKAPFHPGALLVSAGLLLMIVAASIVLGNERNVLNFREAMARHGGQVRDLGHGAVPSPGLAGHMVRVVGVPHVIEPPVDPVFKARADATRLQRLVQMFQWHEIKVGGVISYQMDWIDHLVNWHHFDHPGGHANPRHFPFGDATFTAAKVRLDGFRLSPAMIHGVFGMEGCQPDLSRLPANLAASFRMYQGALVSSADPASPRVGDLMVSWLCVLPKTITVLAQVRGNGLVVAPHAQISGGFDVQIGDRTLRDMLPDTPQAPQSPWLWRVTALLLAWIGAYLVSRGWRRPRLEPVATLSFAVAVVCGFAGTLWVGMAWALGGALLAVTIVAVTVTAWLLRLQPPQRRQHQT